jgi:hypothetical protein
MLLLFLFVSGPIGVGAQDPTWKPPEARVNNCEANDHYLDTAHQLAGDNSIIIAVAHLGNGERNPELNRRRLHNVRAYLTSFAWKRRPDTVITAEGEKVNGNGRVDIYVRGGLWAALAVKRNGDLLVGLCEPDSMRGREETNTFYPWRDRKKP